MSLLKRVKELLELDNVVQEAERKLHKTIMIVNGEALFVHSFNYNANIINCVIPNGFSTEKKYKSVQYETLDIWLPESGMYYLPDGTVCTIKKIPYRQWHRSFKTSYYDINTPFGMKDFMFKINLYNYISKQKPSYILVDKFGKIRCYPNLHEIGRIKNNNTITCTNKLYLQELKDWSRTCLKSR